MTHFPVTGSVRDAVLARRDVLLRRRTRIHSLMEKLRVETRAVELELSDCVAAGRLFGFPVALPVTDEEIAEAQGRVRLYEERARSTTETNPSFVRAQLANYKRRLEDLLARRDAAKAEEAERAASEGDKPPPPLLLPSNASEPSKSPRIRDLVLQKMQEEGGGGLKAATIRSFIEETQHIHLHEKTVGMTLYRLSKEPGSQIHRIGQTWFYGSQAGQSPPVSPEDPGAGAPGLTQDAN